MYVQSIAGGLYFAGTLRRAGPDTASLNPFETMAMKAASPYGDEDGLPFFESSLAVFSSIGLCLTGVGIWAMFITRLSPLHAVPMVTSTACAVANGLSYYAVYTPASPPQQAVASVFADLCWLVCRPPAALSDPANVRVEIQEAGLSLYNYLILVHALQGRTRSIYRCIFWILIVAIAVVRISILVLRALEALAAPTSGPASLKTPIDFLHIGYFTSIAVVDTYSSMFLIRFLLEAYWSAPAPSPTRSVYIVLLWSAEMRLSSLCFISITRAATYPFHVVAYHAVSVPNQIERFAYTLDCLFPMIFM